MRAIHVSEFVKDLSELKASSQPLPQFSNSSKTAQILIHITHTSPTHVDTLYARGLHQNNSPSGSVHAPFILGTEFAGVVVDVHVPTYLDRFSAKLEQLEHSSVLKGFAKGDRVWGHAQGAFAPYIICAPSALHKLPPNVSLRGAAALGAATAPVSYGALTQMAQLKTGETCLIHAAAGGLGVAAVRIAHALGAKVIATVGSAEKKAVVEDMLKTSKGHLEQGEGVITYDHEGWEREVLTLTRGKGVQVVMDTVGLVQKSIRCCAFGARIIIVGFVGLGGTMEHVAMNRILLKGVKVIGYRFGETARQDPLAGEQLWAEFEDLLRRDLLQPVVHRTHHGIGSVPDALRELESRRVCGKIVIETTNDDLEEDEQRGLWKRSGFKI